MLAGDVLRAATNSSNWCDALHATLLRPLGLRRTYCHRNEVPDDVADVRGYLSYLSYLSYFSTSPTSPYLLNYS